MSKIKPIEDYRIVTVELWVAFALAAVIALAKYFIFG